jgi:adenylate cyclase
MRFSLRYKFLIFTILLIIATTVAISIIVLNRVNEKISNEIMLRGKMLVLNLAADLVDPMSRDDDLDPQLLQKEIIDNSDVIYCYIVDEDGLIRAPTTEWQEEYQLPEGVKKIKSESYLIQPYSDEKGDELFHISAPVIYGGEKRLGTVHMGLSKQPIIDAVEEMRNLIFYISGIVLVGGIIVSILFTQFMTRHVKKLMNGVKKIGRGEFGTRVKIKSKDEIGDLAIAFNDMAGNLEKKEMIEGAFRRYVSHQIADRILNEPGRYIESLKGIRKEVSILFADIRGFTSKAEKLPPEIVVNFLNEYLTYMTRAVFKYEGTLDKFTGDGIMAIFGAPVDQKDSTLRAIKSAVEIQKEAEAINKKRIEKGEEPLYIGVGVNTGEVVVGNIGYEDRLDYTVIGDAVNLASRLVDIANGREVLIGDNAYLKVREQVVVEPVGSKRLRGRRDMVNIYKLKSLKI